MILMQLFLFNMFNLDGFEQNKEIILSQGFSLEGLIRGLIGMSVLILIAFLLSNNRKAINWKTASFGLVLQIILAIAVLKISWVKMIFESAGKVFVKILDFTMEGTKFLFGALV